MRKKRRVPPVIKIGLEDHSISTTPSIPGQIIDATGEGRVAVFGADVDHYHRMPKAYKGKAHVYKCGDCDGPVFTAAEYRADDIYAICSSCTEKMGIPLWVIGELQDFFSGEGEPS